MEDLTLSTLRKFQFILQAALGASLVAVGTGEKRPMGHSEHLGLNGSVGRAASHNRLNVFREKVSPICLPIKVLTLPNPSVFRLAKNPASSLHPNPRPRASALPPRTGAGFPDTESTAGGRPGPIR